MTPDHTEPQPPAIKILLVDDHAVVRRGLRAFIDIEPGMEVLGEAEDGAQALALLRERHTLGEPLPDVVLMDLVMPRLPGVEAAGQIMSLLPDIKIVILTSFGEVERVHAALAAGAAGYLLKDAEPEEVASAIRAAAAGEVHLDPGVARELTRRMTAPHIGLSSLTPREKQILALVAEGHGNREIARRLSISERTARTHVSNVLSKLQLSSRTQAALFAISQGVTPLSG
ncbi:response regulator transcription factor [Streptomyces sp. NPDC048290]|uniref:response regulator transcription factor n=1 Tax=Streptomyces sp. NPDC048290 TaxID=3155811 RepID=UPI0034405058